MSYKKGVRHPTTSEVQQISKSLLKITDPHQQRRAEALTLFGMGLSPAEIAQSQGVHLNTIYKDLCAFEELGLKAIAQLRPSGAPRRITAEQIELIKKIAEQSPQAAGLPYGRWTLRKLSEYLTKKRIVKTIGRERLRQLLKKRFSLSAGATQTLQPRPATTGNSGTFALDFPSFAHRWASDFL
jgi:transposase